MKKRGRGIASMYYPIGITGKPNPSSAFLKVNSDGSVVAMTGAVDKGQGLVTVLTQIIADVLGIKFDDIRVISADTETTPYDFGVGASRGTYYAGNAVKRAAEKAKKILMEAVAVKFGLSGSEDLIVRDGKVYLENYAEMSITIREAAWYSERELGKPIIAAESFTPALTGLSPETGQGKLYAAHSYATQMAEVEVDTETGEVQVLKLIAVHDCGKAINPMLLEGQIEGGVVMGLGYTMMEELVEDKNEGGVLNPSFVDYFVPTAADIPDTIIVDLLEEAEEKGPFGAKGAAEPTLLPTAPAITNAIYDAVGVRVYELPVTPEKLLQAMKSQQQ